MKRLTTILSATAVIATFALPAFAASPGISRTYNTTTVQPDPTVIAELQDASDAAQRQALQGNKNNLEFRRKSYEIDQLIQRMKNGQPVAPSELDQALEPARVW
jgi:hypothetical protein